MLSFGLTSFSYGGYFDDFPDDSICLWLIQSPANPVYHEQAEKRGLNCSGGKLVGKANATWADEVETTYKEMTEISEEDKTVLKDNCSETIKKRVRAEEYLSESQSFIELKNYLIDVSLQNAVQQVIGVDISNFQSLSRSSEDGVENENFSETSTSTLTSKTKGTIDSYEIISTEIIDLDTVKILSLEVEAYVCVKDN